MDSLDKALKNIFKQRRIRRKSKGSHNRGINLSKENFTCDVFRKNGKAVGTNKACQKFDSAIKINTGI